MSYGVPPIAAPLLARIMNDPLACMPHNPAARGYAVAYRGADTICPGCGRSHWLVGRMLAECAFCTTAVPLPERGMAHHASPATVQRRAA